jgi:hypothetical protein
LGAILNRVGVEMVANHEQQRTLIYRPRRGAFQRYTVQLGNTIRVGANLAMHHLGNTRAVCW